MRGERTVGREVQYLVGGRLICRTCGDVSMGRSFSYSGPIDPSYEKAVLAAKRHEKRCTRPRSAKRSPGDHRTDVVDLYSFQPLKG